MGTLKGIAHDLWEFVQILFIVVCVITVLVVWAIWSVLVWLWAILCLAFPWFLAIAGVYATCVLIIKHREATRKALEQDRLMRLAFIDENERLNSRP